MKLVTILASVAVVCSLVESQGFPTRKCPPGEHSVLYCPQRAEPDCTNSKVHELVGLNVCDIPQCFCNTPTVRDLKTRKCVKIEDCPASVVTSHAQVSA